MKYEPSVTQAEIEKFIEVSHRDFAHTNRHAMIGIQIARNLTACEAALADATERLRAKEAECERLRVALSATTQMPIQNAGTFPPLTKRKPPTTEQYKYASIMMAFDAAPTIRPCRKCKWPVIEG